MEITVRATDVAPRTTEVPMIEPDSVRQLIRARSPPPRPEGT
jgi:hypothetical protein